MAPCLMHEAPSWFALRVLQCLPASALSGLACLSSGWLALAREEASYAFLARHLPGVACPPELCGQHASWRALFQELACPVSREAAFTCRVVVRFRPQADSYGGAPAPAQLVHVPLHQRLQLLRAASEQPQGASIASLLSLPASDPWRGSAVEEEGGEGAGGASASASASAAPPIPAPLASASVLPSGPTGVLCLAPRVGLRSFTFAAVLPASASQATCYASCARGLVYDFLNGRNATVLAFGQTGSGKTHSMDGAEGRGDGIVPRALADALAHCAAAATSASATLRLTIVELFGDRVRNLLAGGAEVGPWSAAAAAAVAGGSCAVPLASAGSARELLATAGAARAVAATELNARSSRAHTLYMLDLVQRRGGVAVASKLILADLGGSENVLESGAIKCPERLKEAIAINSSLLALRKCIAARLDAGSEVLPPYGDSRLTQLLSYSLSGAARIGVLLACRSEPRFVQHSITALRFGEDVQGLVGANAGGGAAGGDSPGSQGQAAGVLQAIAQRLAELAGEIAKGERWEGGKPVGAEGLREEYEALLATRKALTGKE